MEESRYSEEGVCAHLFVVENDLPRATFLFFHFQLDKI